MNTNKNAPVIYEFNQIDVTEPIQQKIVTFVKEHALHAYLPERIMLDTTDLLGLMELAHYSCFIDATFCSGPMRFSHLMYTENTDYVYDSLLDDLPEDCDDIDDHYENTKRLKADWLLHYKNGHWDLDNLNEILANSAPA